MNRRNFLKLTGAGALALTLSRTATAKAAQPPNIIYILADDLGYGDLSCYGQKKFTTPHLDQMAAEGLKFTDHYSGSTVCAPSRCSLMTGKHTGHAVVRGNREVKDEGQAPMPGDTVTLAHRMQDAGYRTGMFGKWGLGAPGSPSDPVKMGFDEFYGYNCQRQAHNYYPQHLWHNDKKVMLNQKTYAHDLIVEQAFKFIKDSKDKPFFCYMPIVIPHAAMHCPEEDVAPFRRQFPQFENKVGKYAGPDVKNPIAAFAAMVTRMDRQVGQLFELLKKLGIDDNTLVMFTSDNGPHAEGGHDPKFFNSNGPLKGIKRDLYEGGIRVPMIARWPGKIAAGRETDHISAFWDVLPTCLELAGADVPEDTDGISFLPELLGKETQEQHPYLYWEFHERGGSQAIRMGKWKAIKNKVSKNPDAPIELYNLEKDLGETKDVAKQHPDLVKQMSELFVESRTESDTFKLFQQLGLASKT